MTTRAAGQYEQHQSSAAKKNDIRDSRLAKQLKERNARNLTIHKLVRGYDYQPKIDLSYQRLGDRDMPYVVYYTLQTRSCVGLNLSGNNFTWKTIETLLNELANHRELKQLDLSNNRLTDEGVKIICRFLSSSSSVIEDLDLSGNDIEDEGAKYLANMFKKNRTLRELGLKRNFITSKGLESLADALGGNHPDFERLKLDDNPFITEEGVDRALSSLKGQRTPITRNNQDSIPCVPEITLKGCTILVEDYRNLERRADATGFRFVIE